MGQCHWHHPRVSYNQCLFGAFFNVRYSFGDALDAFMAMMVYRTCQQVEGGLPASVQSQMIFNIIIDFFIGLVPFIGDVADGM